MRFITYLLVAGSLIFGGVLLEQHYGIGRRLWQYRYASQPNLPAPQANLPAPHVNAPVTPPPGEGIPAVDSDYQFVIDISGKGPLLTVIHAPEPEAKKAAKKSRKSVVAAKHQPVQTSPQAQTSAVGQTPPSSPTQESGTKPQQSGTKSGEAQPEPAR